jgi:glycerol uptake operon antiterminator
MVLSMDETEYSILPFFEHSRVIAASREDKMAEAMESDAAMVLVMNVSLTWLVRPEFQTFREQKPILIHADLVKGLSGDREAISFLRDFIRPWGIVSTKGGTIRAARKLGVPAIQRLFLIDSTSLRASIDSILENAPTAVELMPGLAPGPIAEVKEAVHLPIIAAGLIRTREEAFSALDAGADAVSMSTVALWNEPFL